VSRRFATGLVVGKFCPLHRGHEKVIRAAMTQCREVLILSYTHPEFAGCEPERREQWLATLFPDTRRLVLTDSLARTWGWGGLPGNDDDPDRHRRLVARVCLERFDAMPDAVFTSESYGEPFAMVLQSAFGKPVVHVSIDPDRREVPASGTALRADPHGGRDYLPPEVYASFVERVVLIGGESTGKSTLAEALAVEWETEWVPEYGRELWENQGGRLEFGDMVRIAEEQVRREEAALRRAKRYVFCDTSPLVTLFYSQEMFGRVDERLVEWANRPYHHTILCGAEFPFVQDGTRQPAGFRERQQAWYRGELAGRGIAYREVSGSLEERVRRVGGWLGSGG